MIIRKGFILVKPDIEHFDGVKIGDTKINIIKLYNEAQHEVVSGHVIMVPDGETEIKAGDEIIFHYRDYPYALDDRRVDGKGNFFLRRSDPFLIIRDGVEIALNEAVIVSPILEDVIESDLIHIPEHIKRRKSLKKATVRVSAKSKHAVYEKYLLPGTLVFFDSVDSIPLQNEMYQKIADKNTLYRMTHDDVLAIKVS